MAWQDDLMELLTTTDPNPVPVHRDRRRGHVVLLSRRAVRHARRRPSLYTSRPPPH